MSRRGTSREVSAAISCGRRSRRGGRVLFPDDRAYLGAGFGRGSPQRSDRPGRHRREPGLNDIRSFLGDDQVQIVSVCDVNREGPGYWDGKVGGREPAQAGRGALEGSTLRELSGCAAYVDYREILGETISTRSGLHAGPLARHPVIEACKAKKDIYCQKPPADRGRRPRDEFRREQIGSSSRPEPATLDPRFRLACGWSATVDGALRRPRRTPRRTGGLRQDGGVKPEPVPEGFDYNRWPARP
ncbi:MAG: hypothetical protein WKF75_16535 [Singulisphaera sp.]